MRIDDSVMDGAGSKHVTDVTSVDTYSIPIPPLPLSLTNDQAMAHVVCTCSSSLEACSYHANH